MKNLGRTIARRPAAAMAAGVMTLALAAAGPATTGAAFAAGGQGNGGGSAIVAHNSQGTMVSHIFGTAGHGRRVTGTFTPKSFSVVGDQLMAGGTLNGVIHGRGAPQRFTQDVTLPVKSINGSMTGLAGGGKGVAGMATGGACNVLNLNLGPLDLNVLGLKVHLNTVVLDITAQPGAGQLLGNLLCQVAGLLDQNTPLSGLLGQVSTLLNQIIGAL